MGKKGIFNGLYYAIHFRSPLIKLKFKISQTPYYLLKLLETNAIPTEDNQ